MVNTEPERSTETKRRTIIPRKHRILSLVLLALILSQTACGAEQQGTADTDAQTSADDTGTTDETTTVGFEYPDVNYDGAEFRILNFDQLWNMYIHLDSPEIDGEVLNDAVYARNRKDVYKRQEFFSRLSSAFLPGRFYRLSFVFFIVILLFPIFSSPY